LINTHHVHDSGMLFVYEALQLCSWVNSVLIVLQHW